MPTVLLSAPLSYPADELREWLGSAGFAVRGHALGAAPGVDFATVAVAVVLVGDQPEAAISQTRRWRAELGDEHVPIIWILLAADPDAAARGFAAGADAVLNRPLDPAVFVAQIRSAVRSRETAGRVSARAAEARLLAEQLNRAFSQIQGELDAARRIRFALLPRSLPEVGGGRFVVRHHPRGRTGGDFYAAHAVGSDRVVFLVGDVLGPGAVGGLLGRFIAETVVEAARGGTLSAGGLLGTANRNLLRLELDDSPLVALLVGVLDATGKLELARAGIPAPVFVPAAGEPEAWAVPGPFLGVAETTYPAHRTQLHPGDRLLIGTDGTRPDGAPGSGSDAPLIEAAARHRELSGQRFLDAVANELLSDVQHEDDFTLLGVEFHTAAV